MDAEEQPQDETPGSRWTSSSRRKRRRRGRGGAAARPRPLELSALKEMTIHELTATAIAAGIPDAAGSKKHDLIFRMLQAQARRGRAPLRRGRPRDHARRLRLPPRPGVELPRRARRHLRLALADPPLRAAHRRHGERPGPPAPRGRALLRAHQGRGGQLRPPGGVEGQGPLRQPDPALPQRPPPPRDDARQHDGARARHADPAGQGAARPHRGRPPHRARRSSCRTSPTRSPPTTPRWSSSCCSSTSGPRRSPTCSAR